MLQQRQNQTESVVRSEDVNASYTMQLATSRDDQPWNCSVYFVMQAGNFYWLSFPDRRHSIELERNPRAAIAIVLKAEQPVVGIQAEGDVVVVDDITEARGVLDAYINKYDQGRKFIANFEAGTNKHSLYRFTPRRVMVFNERDDNLRGLSPREAQII